MHSWNYDLAKAGEVLPTLTIEPISRASLALYNTEREINTLIGSLMKCKKLFD